MTPENEDPSSSTGSAPQQEQIRAPISTAPALAKPATQRESFFQRLRYLFTGNESGAGDMPLDEQQNFEAAKISDHERILFNNILELRDVKVMNIMIPRVDIAALDIDMPENEMFEALSQYQYSRFPVYKGTLDEVLGTVHIKDIMANWAVDRPVQLKELIREVPIVSPSMPILDLLLEMRHTRRHIALVVDEFGGIDGLITIGDVIETIIGEISDEHDTEDEPHMIKNQDGTVLADARVDIGRFEETFGDILSEEDRDESDTLGGLVFTLAGRVPARGEILTHNSGMVFEILDADPRKINLLKIRNIPGRTAKLPVHAQAREH